MRSRRLDALVLLLLATPVAILPFLDWYAASAPGGQLRISGISGSPELAVVVILAFITMAAAVRIAAHGGAIPRLFGFLLIAAGALMAGWSIEGYLDVPVNVVVDDRGATLILPAELWSRWPGIAAAALSAGIALVGIALAWPRRRA